VGVKVGELWRKGFVEKMSFEPGPKFTDDLRTI